MNKQELLKECRERIKDIDLHSPKKAKEYREKLTGANEHDIQNLIIDIKSYEQDYVNKNIGRPKHMRARMRKY